MTFAYCWHRPGRRIRADVFACRYCGVAIEECPGVAWRNACAGGSLCPCEGSGWVAIVRSKRQAFAQVLESEIADIPRNYLSPKDSLSEARR